MLAVCEYCKKEYDQKPSKKPRTRNFCCSTHSRLWYYHNAKENEAPKHRKKASTSKSYIDRIRRYVGERHAYRPPKSITEVNA